MNTLHWSAKHGQLNVVETLVKQGVEINAKDSFV